MNRAATDTQTILIQDTTAPEFGTAPNVSVTSASNVTSVAVNYDVPAATDLPAPVTITLIILKLFLPKSPVDVMLITYSALPE